MNYRVRLAVALLPSALALLVSVAVCGRGMADATWALGLELLFPVVAGAVAGSVLGGRFPWWSAVVTGLTVSVSFFVLGIGEQAPRAGVTALLLAGFWIYLSRSTSKLLKAMLSRRTQSRSA